MAPQSPLTDAELNVVVTFVDQIVARGLMSSASVEIETIRRLVYGYRVHQRNCSERLAYLKQSGLGYFTDEILSSARRLSEEILIHASAGTWDRALLLARVVLGDRAALDAARKAEP